jgi:hypothetical protein
VIRAAVQQELPEASELDRAVRRVLARPEFAERELPGPLQWLVDHYISLRDALGRMILDALGGSAPVLRWVFVAALVAALVVILVYLGRSAMEAWRSPGGAGGRGGDDETAETEEAVGPAAWEVRAREEADEGRLREAALALYRAVLLRLDERDALSYVPSKTPGDYRRETPEGAPAAGALRRFLALFEPIAFGGGAVSRNAYERLASAAREAGARV